MKYMLWGLVVREWKGGSEELEYFIVENIVKRVLLYKAYQSREEFLVSGEKGVMTLDFETNVQGFKQSEANHTKSGSFFFLKLLKFDDSCIYVAFKPFFQFAGFFSQVTIR